jgi:hypothetical protein
MPNIAFDRRHVHEADRNIVRTADLNSAMEATVRSQLRAGQDCEHGQKVLRAMRGMLNAFLEYRDTIADAMGPGGSEASGVAEAPASQLRARMCMAAVGSPSPAPRDDRPRGLRWNGLE